MATFTITTNPYKFNIVEDMVITPLVEAVIPTGSLTMKRTRRSTWNTSFTVPAHITVVRCGFTWGYGSDERSRLKSGIRHGPGYGCGIRNATNGQSWFIYKNKDTYIKVTPGKTYTLQTWVDGFKDRDYGFIVYWSPSYNTYSYQVTDT